MEDKAILLVKGDIKLHKLMVGSKDKVTEASVIEVKATVPMFLLTLHVPVMLQAKASSEKKKKN